MALISVIMPTYNCAKYILEALESIFCQSYINIEVIVVDDGSTDNTKDVLKPYMNNIRYIYIKNGGPAAARNRGIKEAKGDYIAFLDADDIWDIEKLKKSIVFLEDNNFDWVCTSTVRLSKSKEKSIVKIKSEFLRLNSNINQLINGLYFFSESGISIQTILAHKKCFERAGIFDESFLIGEDIDLWLRFEENGLKGGYLDEPLAIYRYNESSITKNGKLDNLKYNYRLAKKHALLLGIDKPLIKTSYASLLWQFGDIYYSSNKYFRALKYIILSIYYDKSNMKRIWKKLYKIYNKVKGDNK